MKLTRRWFERWHPEPAVSYVVSPAMPEITDREYAQFQRFIYEAAGIALGDSKRILVTSRLGARLMMLGVPSYSAYLSLLAGGADPDEVQTAVDLLTTNETYFFREPRHFEFLREQLRGMSAAATQPVRIWSAAGSSGEEAYSIAMVLEDCLRGRPWEVVASDISTRVLERARAGNYPLERARNIPLPHLQRFCLKGQGPRDNTLRIEAGLRRKVHFCQINLNATLPPLGAFDWVFLRNVLIYFNAETRKRVIARVISVLKPGGWLLISHTESLYDLTLEVRAVAPSIYFKPITAAHAVA
jgi:chemotaxis protein methyltransferase CheR